MIAPPSAAASQPDLYTWLQRRALQAQKSGAARVYVVSRAGRVVAYVALAAGGIARKEAGRSGRSSPNPVPVVIIARLAVDRREQGRGLGGSLLRSALARIATAGEMIGARAVLVHAIHDEARAFYEHFDFRPTPGDDHTLLLMMAEVRKTIGP